MQGKLKMKRQDLEELRGRRSRGLDNENSMVKFTKVTRHFHSVWGIISDHFPQSGRLLQGWGRKLRGGNSSAGRVGGRPSVARLSTLDGRLRGATENEI